MRAQIPAAGRNGHNLGQPYITGDEPIRDASGERRRLRISPTREPL
jgi:hypothetical protein